MADDEEIDRGEIAMRFLSQAPPLQFPPVLDGKSDLFVVTNRFSRECQNLRCEEYYRR